MKKIICISAFVFIAGLSFSANAQAVKKTTQEVKKDANKVGNKTAEIASKGKSRVTDNVYKDKVGPNGETIYINSHSKYYWVDKKGHRKYVTEGELKDKTRK